MRLHRRKANKQSTRTVVTKHESDISSDHTPKASLQPYAPRKNNRNIYDLLNSVPQEAYDQFRTLWMRSKSADSSTIKKAEDELEAITSAYPSTPYYKLFCASLDVEVQDLVYFLKYGDIHRPQDMELIPNTWDEFVALDLSRHEWPSEAGEVQKTYASAQESAKQE